MTAVTLAELAGENELNLSNINLVGLTDQGLVYSLG
jgi:chromatin segregation and condensation protein Rec8/ScpA/Scc1 (kleisin family)